MIRKRILVFIFGILIVASIIFFVGEKVLDDGWYYIPERAIQIALILCVLWQCMLIVGVCLLQKQLKIHLSGWIKNVTRVISVVVTISLILLFAWNWILYNLKFDIKVEQYDEHIALYVKNTFVRTEYREPHYRYEVNWLLMRELNDDELEEAIQKYGSPDAYYDSQH